MGADRKGPLAAFIVIAIIAAILLITSVRSQAATGWPRRALPSTSTVVQAVGGGLDRVVDGGLVLVHTTAGLVSSPDSGDTDASGAGAHVAVSPSRQPTQPTTVQQANQATAHPATQPSAGPHVVRHEVRHHGRGDVSGPASPGRHLGWTHGHAGHTHAGHPHPSHGQPGHDHGDHPDHPDHPDHDGHQPDQE